MRILWIAAVVIALAPVAAAQGAGSEEEYDIEAAMRLVEKLMGQAEEQLLDSMARERAAEAGRAAVEEIEKLLRGNQASGQEIVDKINEILENLPQQEGGGGGQSMPEPEDGEKREKSEEQEVGDRDPRNSRQGDPEGGQHQKPEERKEEATKPPPEEGKEQVPVDPTAEWLARLPDQVREDVLNGRFDKLPPKYKALLEAYTKKMAEAEDDR